jgi:aryl-alcohol dehydrogenase-like predicted oxidoreductase
MDCDQRNMSRRAFVRDTGTAIGGLAAAQAIGLATTSAAESEAPLRVPRGVLGRTGVEVSRLGLGCSHFQRKHIDAEHVRNVLLKALELDVNYLDVAPNYGNPETGFSEEKLGPAIKEFRDRVFLVTKTEEPTYDGTWRLLRQSMRRLQTDYLDLVHLHNFGHEPRFSDLERVLGDDGALGALLEARKQGVVRFIGASGHLHPSRFHVALDTGQIDVLMNAVNFVTQHTYDFEHKVWSRARRMNVGLVAMKVLGGAGQGQHGFRLPAQSYHDAIRYALSIPGLSCAVIGIANIEELEEAAAAVASFQPLTDVEAHTLSVQGLELAGTDSWSLAYGEPLT